MMSPNRGTGYQRLGNSLAAPLRQAASTVARPIGHTLRAFANPQPLDLGSKQYWEERGLLGGVGSAVGTGAGLLVNKLFSDSRLKDIVDGVTRKY
jgi:hypothetical protein